MNDDASPIKILIIDDEPAIRLSFTYYLEDLEFQVFTAENGRIGIELIKREKPDLVLSDLRMPEMDGFGVINHCAEFQPDLPLIVISGANRIDEAIEALRMGAWDYLVKPVKDLSILGHTVDKMLERSSLLKQNREHQEHLEVMVQKRTQELESAFKALQKSEKQYRTLFEKTNDAIFTVDKKKGTILDANKAASDLICRTPTEIKSLDIFEIADVYELQSFKSMLNSNEASEFGQVAFGRVGDRNRIAIVSFVPVDQDSVIIIARDITHSLEIEEQLRQSQKMEAIGTLAGGIAHDFNNILYAILGYSELCILGLEDDDPLKFKLEAINQSGERAKDLISQILAFSRSDKKALSPVRLDLLMKEALKLLRPAIPSTINMQLKIETKERVLGDPTGLHQIIMNLCTNAYQAMQDKGGDLTIQLESVEMEEKAAQVIQVDHGLYIMLTVKDSGCGISPETLLRIFDPYFTTKDKGKGTGMGLAVVHGIVKNHNGAITVTSELEKGTEFKVYLPVSLKAGSKEVKAKSDIPRGNEKILLVDDEIDIVRIEAEILKKLGYDVVIATDVDEAMDLFIENEKSFDLVLSDMTMPKLTGIKLTEKIKELKPDVKVIICSGYNENISEQNCIDNGVDGYLAKPVTMVELAEIVRNVLDCTVDLEQQQ